MSILFVNPPDQPGRMEREWPEMHPELHSLMLDWNDFSDKQGLPPPTFTQLVRYREEQKAIYFQHWKQLISTLQTKGPDALTLLDRQTAQQYLHFTDEELMAEAEKRFTWHWVACAVDMRTVGPNPAKPHYSLEQMQLAVGFFNQRCPKPLWEFLVHDVHGPHMHIGRRDFSWRQKYASAPPPTTGVPNA